MKLFSKISVFLLITITLNSCVSNNSNTPTSASAKENTTNYLIMKINGKEWKADSEIFGAFHPPGYDNAIIIAGSKRPKDKNEQAFNINLYKTNGTGVFQLQNGNKDGNVIQLAGLTEQNFMYGSMMGFNVKLTITKASKNPTIVEARFEGELTGNASDKLIITDGKFYYHE
jgi:hypothetical protein